MSVDLATKLELVTDYYGAGTIWDRMSIDGLSADQINAMYNSLPASSFSVDRTPSGVVLGRNYANPFELPTVPGTDFDSNISGGSYGSGNTFTGNVPANIVTDPNTGLPVRQTAGALNSSGLSIATIADRISLAVAGVNIGARLGMAIDSALYSLNPSWWDEHLPSINPQTWNSLVGQNPVGDFFLRTLFGIRGNQMTGYISADALAYYYQMLRDTGVFNEPGRNATYTGDTSSFPYPNITSIGITSPKFQYPNSSRVWLMSFEALNISQPVYQAILRNGDSITWIWFSKGNCDRLEIDTRIDDPTQGAQYLSTNVLTDNNITFNGTQFNYTARGSGLTPYTQPVTPNISDVSYSVELVRQIATIIFDGTITETGGVDGVTPMTGATQYPPTNITGQTPQEVDQQLRQQYPDLYQDAITETTMQDDGTTHTTEYIPVPWVTDGLNPEQPTTTDGRDQTSEDVDEQTGQQILPTSPTDQQTQPPDTGEGSTPVTPVPTGSASSLWAVYNPSQSEINSFGAWLWSSNFVEQIKKLFADPMQAIIGVHKVFATPHTSGSQTIKCGYLDSGVSASVVSSQYTTVDCGSASLREYFGNVFDYDPYTKVSIFLPFIGIVPLNTADVMRSTVSVKYKVDVITGACLAEVSISRDGGGGILYTYGGSAIVTYPVSSGSYVGAVQAALSTAIGIGSAIASGGASLGASAGMVLGGLSHAKTQVQHSGQFSGSSGAMGGKKPYLIVSRPQTRTPSKISEYKGLPSNAIHKLSSCTGFVKVNEVHITSKSAYDNEIQEIESLLKSGVIF